MDTRNANYRRLGHQFLWGNILAYRYDIVESIEERARLAEGEIYASSEVEDKNKKPCHGLTGMSPAEKNLYSFFLSKGWGVAFASDPGYIHARRELDRERLNVQ